MRSKALEVELKKRSAKRYFYIRCDEHADRGFNIGIEVYLLRHGGYPVFVGSNYQISAGNWSGERVEANKIVEEVCGHKIGSVYNLNWKSPLVQVRSIEGY